MAIVGAGAAGLMAAIASSRAGGKTVLFDRRRKVGAKILMSGGTRCNVTNASVSERDYVTSSGPFVRKVLRQFPPEETREFFERLGVKLKLEPTGKFFPVSDSAGDVLTALLRAVDAERVELRRDITVDGISRRKDGLTVSTSEGELDVSSVVLATGGLSYPQTGSDGLGYRIAERLGHSIVRTSAALTPLIASPPIHAGLAGITLDAELRVVSRSRIVAERFGSLLFTHTGYSGPVVLDISRHWERASWEDPDAQVLASFAAGRSREDFDAHILAEAARAPRRHVANLLAAIVPQRLAETLMAASGISAGTMLSGLGRDARRRLVDGVCALRLPVDRVAGFGKAEVTAGGIPLLEVRARDMSSKIVDGLYFAGEILDVDGYIGGFNFQWAWSTGWVAGTAAAKRAAAFRHPRTPLG